MATRKPHLATAGASAKPKAAAAAKSTGQSTASARPPTASAASQQRIAAQQAGTQKLAAAMPFNALKRDDHGLDSGHRPQKGQSVDSGGRPLTTNQGLPISDNQNSLKAGLRGPVLLEDFVLREKINH